MMDFPWKDQATLVRITPGQSFDGYSGEILFEGTLLAMTRKVRDMKRDQRKGLRISLPDRHVRPNSFQDEALSSLIESMPAAVR